MRGTKAGEVFVMAGPSLGNIALRAWRFGKMFSVRDDGREIVIVVEPEAERSWSEHYPLQLPPPKASNP